MADASSRHSSRAAAVIIAVGSELTKGRVADTNTAWLSRQLTGLGVEVVRTMIVPDERSLLEAAIRDMLALGPGLVVVSGGLGPTHDDITAAAVAGALALPCDLDDSALAAMKRKAGFESPREHHRKQAILPAGSTFLEPVGTAPGFFIAREEFLLVALPGVPLELKAMWSDAAAVAAIAEALGSLEPPGSLAACFYGSGEPAVDAALMELLGPHSGIEAGVCSRHGEVEVCLDFPPEKKESATEVIAALKDRFGDYFYSDGETVESVIVRRLAEEGATLAVAESCTGGQLAGAITDVSGASNVFRGGVVAYHNDVKVGQLGVRAEIIENAGAVSEPVAQWMAVGVRSRLDADFGIGITGIAGPTGGSEEKPVGLVFICVSSPEGDEVARFDFAGGRFEVRRAAVVAALHMLLDRIEGSAPGFPRATG